MSEEGIKSDANKTRAKAVDKRPRKRNETGITTTQREGELIRHGSPWNDLSDRFGSQRPTSTATGHVLHFHSVATGATVHFKAFLTEYADQYESDWNDEPTFGRMDPISTFQRTKRTINLGWDVPAASVDEAKFNLAEAERFISMLYPVYTTIPVKGGLSDTQQETLKSIKQQQDAVTATTLRQEEFVQSLERAKNLKGVEVAAGASVDTLIQRSTDLIQKQDTEFLKLAAEEDKILNSIPGERKASVMVAAPLFKLKFSNLIMDNRPGISIKSGAARAGLVGKLSGLTYQPDIEHGFFGDSEFDGIPENSLIPQTIKFSCQFTVLHTEPLGWSQNKSKRTKAFPYRSDDMYTKTKK